MKKQDLAQSIYYEYVIKSILAQLVWLRNGTGSEGPEEGGRIKFYVRSLLNATVS